MGLREVLRGKRKAAVTKPSGEPWRPVRNPGEDTVEIASVVDGPVPGETEQDAAPGRPAERSAGEPVRPIAAGRAHPAPAG